MEEETKPTTTAIGEFVKAMDSLKIPSCPTTIDERAADYLVLSFTSPSMIKLVNQLAAYGDHAESLGLRCVVYARAIVYLSQPPSPPPRYRPHPTKKSQVKRSAEGGTPCIIQIFICTGMWE